MRTTMLASLRAQALRQQQQRLNSVSRRFASSSSSSSSAEAKAQEALAGAKKGLDGFVKAASGFAESVGGRLGGLLGSYRQPLVYNFSVARELLKQVYIAERLQPPSSFSTISSAYNTIWRNASSPEFWREIVKTGQWKRVGVYAVEAYGVFKIGEILGRRNLVGYNLQ